MVDQIAGASVFIFGMSPSCYYLAFGEKMRTLKPGRTQVNILKTRKQEHSRKPDEMYDIIEACSPGPYLELFARERRTGWTQWVQVHALAPTGAGDVP